MLTRISCDANFQRLKRIYMDKSFLEILGVENREISHSAFLAWLLDNGESHGLGSFPMQQFLKILIKRDQQQGLERHDNWQKENKIHPNRHTTTKEIGLLLIQDAVTFGKMTCKLELSVNKGREDVHIHCPIIIHDQSIVLHIIIENKFLSDEKNSQTSQYYTTEINNCSKQDYLFFVYLTPKSKDMLDQRDTPECSCKEYIQICYQDIMDYILSPCLVKEMSDRSRLLIKEYIHCLEYSKKRNTIMATSNETRNMLYALWHDNKALFSAMLDVIMQDRNEDIYLRAYIHKVTSGKEYVFVFNDEIIDSNADLVRAIRKYLKDSLGFTLKDISDAFVKNRKVPYGNIKAVLQDNMTTTDENNFNPTAPSTSLLKEQADTHYEKNDDNCYFYNDWNKPNLDLFLYTFHELCKKSGIESSYKIIM